MSKNKHHGGKSGPKHHDDHDSGHQGKVLPPKGTNGDDTLVGSERNELILGRKGDDAIDGGAGNDILLGGRGDDQLLGGTGNDILIGDAGSWRHCHWWTPKGQGDDYLDGGAGCDIVLGGRGNDIANYTLSENRGARDLYDGGKGFDTLQLSLTHAEAQLASVQADIARFEAFLQSPCHSDARSFHFASFDLTVRGFEDLEIRLVGGGNAAPQAVDDSFLGQEDMPLNGNVLGNDTDEEGSTLSATLVSGPAHGSVAWNGDGSFTYTPDEDFNGSDSFTYRASDGQAESNVATVRLTVGPQNDEPVAAADSATANEDAFVVIDVLANDVDADGDELSALVVSGPAHGTLGFNPDGTVTYTPDADFFGEDSFTYRASDGPPDSNMATVSITVNAVNDAPDAVDDAFLVAEDSGANSFAVLANDTFAPDAAETLSVSQVTQGTSGTVAITVGAGGITYTPNANFVGTDSFTYTISDGNGGSDTATVSVTVNAVNDAPVAGDDTGPVRVAVVGSGSTTYNAVAAQLNDSTAFDIEAVVIPVTDMTQAEWETALLECDVVAIGGSGQADDFGDSSLFSELRIFVNEGGGVVSTGWFARALAGLQPAQAKADADYVTPITTAGYTALAPNAAITVLDSSHPITNGVPSFISPEFHELANALDPSATALATGGAAGLAAVAYDEVGAGLTVYLGGIYFADPIYTPDTRSGNLDKLFEQAVVWAAGTATDEDTPLSISGDVLLKNDTDANHDALVISSVVQTSTRGASLSFDEATGVILYEPTASAVLQALTAGEIVTDSFEYEISDGHGGTDTATVNVTVFGVDDVTSSTAGIEGLIQALVPIDADVLL
jgi:VCBS repeat-containing protein